LEQLKKFTTIVADTGDFAQLSKYQPQDSTTNPSLILQASELKEYSSLVEDAVTYAKSKGGSLDSQVEHALDKLSVNFGIEILKLIPGRVSTEIDARLSFNTEANVKKGKELIALYRAAGIDKDRILLKIASTWEGLQAAKILEAEGYHCNMTLLFSVIQAAVAGEVGATLISPFAGRITDFYKVKENKQSYAPSDDPGVKSVTNIYNYMRRYGYKTVVMGASFRTKEQVTELAGCDLLTVAPSILKELQESHTDVAKKLCAESAKSLTIEKLQTDENSFRWALNEDEMATVKLSEGIRRFASDLVKLEENIRKKLQ